MGACGCGDTSPYWRFKGPEGSWYTLHVYHGCSDCELPAGTVLFKHEAPDETGALFDGAPQRNAEELKSLLWGSREITPDESGSVCLPMVDRDVVRTIVFRRLKTLGAGADRDVRGEWADEIADDLVESVVTETIHAWEEEKEQRAEAEATA
jgi:hypothetical protein